MLYTIIVKTYSYRECEYSLFCLLPTDYLVALVTMADAQTLNISLYLRSVGKLLIQRWVGGNYKSSTGGKILSTAGMASYNPAVVQATTSASNPAPLSMTQVSSSPQKSIAITQQHVQMNVQGVNVTVQSHSVAMRSEVSRTSLKGEASIVAASAIYRPTEESSARITNKTSPTTCTSATNRKRRPATRESTPSRCSSYAFQHHSKGRSATEYESKCRNFPTTCSSVARSSTETSPRAATANRSALGSACRRTN